MNTHADYDIENICIFGVGGVGGFLGGKIAHGLAEKQDTTKQVYFIARGKHLEEIKKHGLILNTPEERGILCTPTLATDRIEEIPSPDLCLMCVKSYDLDNAIIALKEKVASNTMIIPLLNGVDIYERIRKHLDRGIVLPACVYVGTHIDEPGVVTHVGGPGLVLCGNDPNVPDFNPKGLIDFLVGMGIKFTWNDDPYPAIWEKYTFIAPYALVTAYTGQTSDKVYADPELKELTRKIVEEVVAIGRRRGVNLARTIVTDALDKTLNFPPGNKTSFLRDIEAKNRRNEGDLFGATIIRLGKELGVPTPVAESIYSKIEESMKSWA
jgi:2-dehydropantoate 2-reductase